MCNLVILLANPLLFLVKLLFKELSNGENSFALSLLVFEKMHFFEQNVFLIF